MHTLENDVEITESKSEVLREEFVNRLATAVRTLTLEALYENAADFLEQFEKIVDSKKLSAKLLRKECVTQAETSVENLAEFIDRVDSFLYNVDEDEDEG